MKLKELNVASLNAPRRSWASPLKLAAIYAVAAGLWIVLSDRVLLWLYSDAAQLTWLQTLKGWFFVFATAAMLAWLAWRDQRALQAEIDSCQRTQESFRTLVETIPHGIQECDAQGTILFTNSAYDKIFGLEPGEAIGTRIWDKYIDEGEREKLKNYISSLAKLQPEPTPYFAQNRTKDGRLIEVQVDWNYLRDSQGRVTGFASIGTDVTARLQAEESIRSSDRLKTELISTAAHEFRTPLTTIQGFAELLLGERGFSEAERREYLGYILRKSDDLSEMVDNLLDLSRIEAGQALPLKMAPNKVSEVVAEAAPLVSKLQAQHRVEIDLQAEQTVVAVDSGKIGQVLENLLSNAAKYSPPGSTIKLSGEPCRNGYRLSVTDQGVGMDEAQQARIFERFYRVDSSDTSPSGFGIGMAIVKEIVEGHGGEVQVSSRLGAGTTVSFELPFSA